MTVIVEPVNLAVSIEAARTAARVDGTALDEEIEMWVRAFTKDAEHQTGRAVIDQTHQVTLDRFPEAIRIPVLPVKSAVVRFMDADGAWQTLDPAHYIVDNEDKDSPCYLVPAPGKAWPATFNRVSAVKVEAVCGYGPDDATTPMGFKGYILAKLQAHYDKADAPHACRLIWPYKVFA